MDSPQVTPDTGSQGKDKVTDLIALLDRYLHFHGHILAPGRALHCTAYTPLATLPPPADSGFPVALQVFPAVSLSSHLRDEENDVAVAQDLEQRIRLIHTLCPPVVFAAHARLRAEHAACIPPPSPSAIQSFALKGSLADKLATLRTHQHHNPPEYQIAYFKIVVIKSLDFIGKPCKTSTIYLTRTTDWTSFALALQRATICAQTECAGFPTGYSLKSGPWLVQRTKSNIPLSSTPSHALRNSIDFLTLCAHIERDEKTGVLIWHEKLWARSRELRDEARWRREAEREWAKQALGEELRYGNGELYFEPGYGDELDLDGVEFDLGVLVDPVLGGSVAEDDGYAMAGGDD